MKGNEQFSNVLYHSVVKQHGDILTDIQNLQSSVSTSQALSKFYGLKGQIQKISLFLTFFTCCLDRYQVGVL